VSELRVAIVTVSDRSARGERPDATGPAVADAVRRSAARGEHVHPARVARHRRDGFRPTYHETQLALKKEVRKCNGCGVCNEVCPMNIHSVAEEMEKEDVSTFECIYCMKCVEKCPQDECLRVEFAGKKVAESKFAEAASAK